jgi:hypothetical protein
LIWDGYKEKKMLIKKFKSKKLDEMYRVFLFNPPIYRHPINNQYYRRLGSSLYGAFWRGYDGITNCGYNNKNTFAYACWVAGKDYKKFGGKNYPTA